LENSGLHKDSQEFIDGIMENCEILVEEQVLRL
jgi:hypothetical protein